jgi:hypothetical protein
MHHLAVPLQPDRSPLRMTYRRAQIGSHKRRAVTQRSNARMCRQRAFFFAPTVRGDLGASTTGGA